MFSSIRDKLDSFLGRGKYSASVPVMDGPLQPNRALEEAKVFLSSPGLDNPPSNCSPRRRKVFSIRFVMLPILLIQ